jgi:hypothetical protein
VGQPRRKAILPLCQPCWAGRKRRISRTELVSRIRDDADIPEVDRERVLDILTRGS